MLLDVLPVLDDFVCGSPLARGLEGEPSEAMKEVSVGSTPSVICEACIEVSRKYPLAIDGRSCFVIVDSILAPFLPPEWVDAPVSANLIAWEEFQVLFVAEVNEMPCVEFQVRSNAFVLRMFVNFSASPFESI